jgi:hypothetical protein
VSETIEKVRGISSSAVREFNEILDYIWKSTKMIDQELAIELEKLDAYYPNNPELRLKRFERESAKIMRTFPWLIANSNLLIAVSVFETDVCFLCKTIVFLRQGCVH